MDVALRLENINDNAPVSVHVYPCLPWMLIVHVYFKGIPVNVLAKRKGGGGCDVEAHTSSESVGNLTAQSKAGGEIAAHWSRVLAGALSQAFIAV